MVVMEAKSFYIDRLVEGPGIRHMFLGQHLSDEACTETQLLLPLLRNCPSGFQTACQTTCQTTCQTGYQTGYQMMLRVGLQCVFFGLLRWATALSAWTSLSRDRR